ncbi:hypothetical protein [Streptomyces sp. NPDC058394]
MRTVSAAARPERFSANFKRALRDVHGRLDELTTIVTERLTTAAGA